MSNVPIESIGPEQSYKQYVDAGQRWAQSVATDSFKVEYLAQAYKRKDYLHVVVMIEQISRQSGFGENSPKLTWTTPWLNHSSTDELNGFLQGVDNEWGLLDLEQSHKRTQDCKEASVEAGKRWARTVALGDSKIATRRDLEKIARLYRESSTQIAQLCFTMLVRPPYWDIRGEEGGWVAFLLDEITDSCSYKQENEYFLDNFFQGVIAQWEYLEVHNRKVAGYSD